MRVELPYGRATLPVELPADLDVTIVRKPAMPVFADPAAAVRQALAAPIGSGPLHRFAAGGDSACILICDITRPVPNGLLLRPIVDELQRAGVPLARITVLVATGMHRPNLGAELEELVGDPWVLRHVRVENHHADDPDAHDDLGFTPHGTPVKLDRRFTRAAVKVVTGLVEPHFMAGFSGGRKVIAPGIAHRDTITTFHSHRFMAHPCADNLVLEGNPLHREQLAIAAMLGPVFGVNTVLDEHRRLSFVSAGELIASHLAAVAACEQSACVTLPRRFGTVVTTAAGHPLDTTYYQTIKGMVAPLGILAPGGTLVIASSCREGLGSAAFRDAQQRLVQLGPDAFVQSLAHKRFADADEWQTQMQAKSLQRGQVQLVTTGLDEDALALTGVGAAASVEAAVAASVARTGDRAVAVVPEGPYVVPVCAAG
ncbi:MAG: nickel-dependent lactate racemase [Planctomycetes bacterium]|nr:nickel-dependent lactate racemase [Planctomycetota bacterium]